MYGLESMGYIQPRVYATWATGMLLVSESCLLSEYLLLTLGCSGSWRAVYWSCSALTPTYSIVCMAKADGVITFSCLGRPSITIHWKSSCWKRECSTVRPSPLNSYLTTLHLLRVVDCYPFVTLLLHYLYHLHMIVGQHHLKDQPDQPYSVVRNYGKILNLVGQKDAEQRDVPT